MHHYDHHHGHEHSGLRGLRLSCRARRGRLDGMPLLLRRWRMSGELALMKMMMMSTTLEREDEDVEDDGVIVGRYGVEDGAAMRERGAAIGAVDS